MRRSLTTPSGRRRSSRFAGFACALAALVVAMSIVAGPAVAQDGEAEPEPERPKEKSPFDKGNISMSIVAGWGSAYRSDYFILGVGAGYYLAKGLEAGVDFEAWLGGTPDIYKLSPQVRYVYDRADMPLKPYGGVLWRRTFVQSLDDTNSLGLRGGAYYKGKGGTYVGAGIVYERLMDCDDQFTDCSYVYPEVSVTLRF